VKKGRLVIALVMAGMALLSYYGMRETNPVTGEVQSIGLSKEQEVAIGLQSAPQMAAEFGGLEPDASLQSDVAAIGQKVVSASRARDTQYEYQFNVLADRQTVNAFALPGGPIFITRALLDRLENEAQLAGVLGHEVGHVVGRHAAERIAKSQLAQGLVGAVGVATTDEQGRGAQAAQLAMLVSQVVQMRYGRDDELQSDTLGVDFMSEAGYDPRAMLAVMDILAKASGGGGRSPEFLSTHPDPGNRQAVIQQAIEKKFPGGVPGTVTQGRPITLARGARANR
jgi:beta-barrel assembly-enhancing protease